MTARRELLVSIVLLPLLLLAAPAALAKKPPKPPPPPTSPADPAIVYREQGGYNLWVMNEDGSNATQIYSGKTWRMSWSPNGGSIAFTGDQDLLRIDVDVIDGVPQGSNVTVVVDDPDTTAFSPAWSPAGDVIAYMAIPSPYTEPGELRVIPANGGTPQVLYTPPPGQQMFGGTWSPDGDRIAFLQQAAPDDEDYRLLRILDVDTGWIIETHELPVNSLHYGFYALDWARTKDVIAYEAGTRVPDRGGKTRKTVVIHTLDLDSGDITAVVEGEMPSWSPDDSQLVLRSWERRTSGIYVYDFATNERDQILGGSKWAPEWRR